VTAEKAINSDEISNANSYKASCSSSKMTFLETRRLIRADIRRRLELQGRSVTYLNALAIAIMPGVFTVLSYRIANYLHFRGHRLLPMIINDIVHLYCRNELLVGSRIGPGLVLGDCPGVGIGSLCRIGSNCTVLGILTTTIQSGVVNVMDPDTVLGNNCIIGSGTRVVGAISLADGTQTKPNSVVLRSSFIPGAILDGVPARQKGVVSVTELASWNPLRPDRGIGSSPVNRGAVARCPS
jgi:serine O-acetyltransferase